jgi:uroporphyrinogen-III synthase
MSFSHVLLTRPRPQSGELAAMLRPLGLEVVIQPAFSFSAVDSQAEQPGELKALQGASADDLVVFTSPRSVEYGLPQLSSAVFSRIRVAAIGPSTARALQAAGIRVDVQPERGYTSEDLLETLASGNSRPGPKRAFIVTAPGGRKKLARSLVSQAWDVSKLMVYRSDPEPLDRDALGSLQAADGILSVWTSANSMKALSQRLPPKAWFRICEGEWLVISERLKRLARAYAPSEIHLSSAPDNTAILSAIRNLA